MCERVRLGLVGLQFGRHILKDHILSGAGKPYFELAGVCSKQWEQTSQASHEFGVRGYADLDEMIADRSVNAVALFTGPAGRAELIRKIIRAGKDVITTKPFETDPEAALDVLVEAKRLGRVVQMNSPSPALPPDLRQILQWQEQYNLGRVIGCRAGTWACYREQADGSWYDDPEQAPVAPIFRLGIYLLNDLVRLIGPAESVQVMQSRVFTGRPTADNAQLSILFGNGAIASVFASFCIRDREYYKGSLVLNFENGTVYRNAGPLASDWQSNHADLSVVLERDGAKIVDRASYDCCSGEYQWDVFYQSIRSRQQESVKIEQIVEGIRVVNAMARAAKTGRMELVHGEDRTGGDGRISAVALCPAG